MGWWWKQEIHSSWRIALACVAFVVGVTLSLWIRLPVILGAILLLLLVAVLYARRLYILFVVVFMAVALGISYGSLHLAGREKYGPFIGKDVVLRGRIKEDVSQGSSGGVSVQLDSVHIGSVQLPGSVLATGRTVHQALRGDIIKIRGKLKEGFGSFAAGITIISITAIERQPHGDVGRVVRDWFAGKVRQEIPEPQASLGVGFLTGQKSALSPDLAESLKIAGLTHIVVASGYNLTILVRLARKLLLKFSKYLSTISSGLMIAAFVMVTGLSPSMTRAGLVSSMSLLSWYYGHAFHPFVLLPVAAAITVAIQPSYVWGDLGWQLSFSAFVGVMVVAPLLQTYFFGNKEPGTFRQILGETLAAHIVTVPILAISFGTMSNVAIIANILVVPLVPLAMLLTFLCGSGAIAALPFIELLATPTSWLLGYMTNVATFVAELPWAQSQLEVAPSIWALYGIVLAAACYWMWRKTNYNFRKGEALMMG